MIFDRVISTIPFSMFGNDDAVNIETLKNETLLLFAALRIFNSIPFLGAIFAHRRSIEALICTIFFVNQLNCLVEMGKDGTHAKCSSPASIKG